MGVNAAALRSGLVPLTWTLSSSLTICSCSLPTSDRTRTDARNVSTCESGQERRKKTKPRTMRTAVFGKLNRVLPFPLLAYLEVYN